MADTGTSERPRAHHDMGGVPRFLCEEIDIEPHALSAFDRQVDALRQLLAQKGLMTVDELRRGIEEIPEQDYLRLSYYQKWIRSIAATLIRRGVIDPADLAERLGRERAHVIAAGATVQVKDEWPEADGPVHVRTPHYVRGRRGTIVRHLGDFPDPGDIAFARPPAIRSLYHVAFPFRELWPDGGDDELVVEIYEHWLEPERKPS